MTPFLGWKIGKDVHEGQAVRLDPHVDVLDKTLTMLEMLNTDSLIYQSQHALTLAMIEYIGGAAALINEISLQLANDNEADVDLLTSMLHAKLLTVAALANVAIVALDKTLKEE